MTTFFVPWFFATYHLYTWMDLAPLCDECILDVFFLKYLQFPPSDQSVHSLTLRLGFFGNLMDPTVLFKYGGFKLWIPEPNDWQLPA